MLNLPLSHVNVKFVLDGKEYDVEHFEIGLEQPADFKGQPQHEVKGGRMSVRLTQIPDDNLYQWAKVPTQMKDGSVVFQTDLGMTVLRFEFENAYCVGLTCNTDAMKGTTSTISISSENLIANGLTHTNYWPPK